MKELFLRRDQEYDDSRKDVLISGLATLAYQEFSKAFDPDCEEPASACLERAVSNYLAALKRQPEDESVRHSLSIALTHLSKMYGNEGRSAQEMDFALSLGCHVDRWWTVNNSDDPMIHKAYAAEADGNFKLALRNYFRAFSQDPGNDAVLDLMYGCFKDAIVFGKCSDQMFEYVKGICDKIKAEYAQCAKKDL
ncbi:hypothetical protein GF345_00015 [Candidatus Woesearchaeota archaeon]|nr:hypothetical protein [Candidatus Woesearchaeota archaeon]